MSVISGGIGRNAERSALATVRHGLSLTPEFRKGLAGTLALAVVATTGKIIVPIAVQQTIDTGLGAAAPTSRTSPRPSWCARLRWC